MPCPSQLSCFLHSFVIYKQLRLIALRALSIRVEFNASTPFFSLPFFFLPFSSLFSFAPRPNSQKLYLSLTRSLRTLSGTCFRDERVYDGSVSFSACTLFRRSSTIIRIRAKLISSNDWTNFIVTNYEQILLDLWNKVINSKWIQISVFSFSYFSFFKNRSKTVRSVLKFITQRVVIEIFCCLFSL